MKKLLPLLAFTLIAPAAFAETTHSDIAADKGAIAKDNVAISKQDSNMKTNRAEKAAAKRNGNMADQASQSVQLGANHTAKAAKNAEKSVDQKILKEHKEDMREGE